VHAVTLQKYDSAGARAIRDTVRVIYSGSYVDAIASGDPFDTVEAFMHRFEIFTKRDGFVMFLARCGNEPLGQTWGWPLDEKTGARWWAGLVSEPEPGFTREDGKRTFALSEIMVRQEYTSLHIAHALHDELLSTRPEQRATLLVEPDNTVAYRAYLHWGWRKVAQLRPGWTHAPLFEVLVLPLPPPS
jgi:ribosomal protein S18 acetylase RimI-like enzyme